LWQRATASQLSCLPLEGPVTLDTLQTLNAAAYVCAPGVSVGKSVVFARCASCCCTQIREDTDAEQLPRGTRVTLHLKEDAAEYADDKKLGALIKQYSEFIAFPIKLWAKRWAISGPCSCLLLAEVQAASRLPVPHFMLM
jgi:Hsp90 protein